MDRLSHLPDELIHRIFSFLPMEYVVRTTVLSKRWVDLWTTVPYLSFEKKPGCALEKLRNFVNRTMMLWRGTKIHKFSFRSFFVNVPFHHDVNLWVRLAMRHKVEELYLLCCCEGTGCCLPNCLLSSSSITKLELTLCHADSLFHGNIHWDQLKSLRIENFYVDQLMINNVLLGSPQLEFLYLSCGRNLSIHSNSLKKLSLDYEAEDEISDSELHIWTPNLQVLTIQGPVLSHLLFLFVPSLIEANLTFYRDNSDFKSDVDMLKIIFQRINHVDKLVVGDWFIKVLQVLEKTALPSPLLNLKRLTIDTFDLNESPIGIVKLLEISPNIAMLTIKNCFGDCGKEVDDVFSEVELSNTFLMNLRILDLELYHYRVVFSIAKFVLKNAKALEKIVIKGSTLVGEMQELLRIPGYSTNAEVVLC